MANEQLTPEGEKMEIHNSVEDLVLDAVDELFFEIERENRPDKPCTCSQCRLDVATYVLNRMPPRYIVSSRGVERADLNSLDRQQMGADISILVHEGLSRISATLRPHYPHDSQIHEEYRDMEGPVFNFPTVVGRIFSGINFEPLSSLRISLYKGEELGNMIEPSWQNPYELVVNTAGTFSFWLAPETAASLSEAKTFPCSIVAKAEGYDDLRHFFDLSLVSEDRPRTSYSLQRTLKLPDLYIFPIEDGEGDS